MVSDPEEIRERAWVEHRRPPIADVDEPMWIAEDPETDCAGVGLVEAEAVGNLASAIAEYENPAKPDRPLLKLPGRVIDRPSSRVETSSSTLDRLRSLF